MSPAILARHEALWTEIALLHTYYDNLGETMVSPITSPLCRHHWQRHQGSCRGCPVNTRSHGRGCEGSPWAALSRAMYNHLDHEDDDTGIPVELLRLRLRQQIAHLVDLTR